MWHRGRKNGYADRLSGLFIATVSSMILTTSDGAAVVVEEATTPSERSNRGLPLVLLHGLSQQRRYWSPVVSRLRIGRVVTLDQRGHGDAADAPVASGGVIGPDADYSMDRLALDVVEVLDALSLPQAIVVGHSWGASVALHAAAAYPDRFRACTLIDGGLFGPRHLVASTADHDRVREALRPPPLGIVAPALWQAISTGDLSAYWSPEVQAALEPTFRVDEMNRAFTRIGMDRHMAVLDGLFDYDPTPDVASLTCPAWTVVCEPRKGPDPDDPLGAAWSRARQRSIQDLPEPFFLQRWSGALHDVPLQWPDLVAGLLATVVERTDA